MTLAEFSRAMGRRPFQPFTLVTVDGQRFTVDPRSSLRPTAAAGL
jgi:hypothetical protein